MQTLRSIPVRSLCLILIVLFGGAAAAQAASPDVGLVTRLSGEVDYWDQDNKPVRAQAFMKVRQGDRFKLAKNDVLTLLYFAGGRQETWQGPVILTAGLTESSTQGCKNPPSPEVKMMPASAIQKIGAAPFPLPRPTGGAGAALVPAPGRAGATMTKRVGPPLSRGDASEIAEKAPTGGSAIQAMAPVCRVPKELPPPEVIAAEMKKAEAVYQELKSAAGAGDFTPELYFLGVLAEYRKFEEMNKILDSLLQQKPGDEALKAMKNWVQTQALCGG